MCFVSLKTYGEQMAGLTFPEISARNTMYVQLTPQSVIVIHVDSAWNITTLSPFANCWEILHFEAASFLSELFHVFKCSNKRRQWLLWTKPTQNIIQIKGQCVGICFQLGKLLPVLLVLVVCKEHGQLCVSKVRLSTSLYLYIVWFPETFSIGSLHSLIGWLIQSPY